MCAHVRRVSTRCYYKSRGVACGSAGMSVEITDKVVFMCAVVYLILRCFFSHAYVRGVLPSIHSKWRVGRSIYFRARAEHLDNNSQTPVPNVSCTIYALYIALRASENSAVWMGNVQFFVSLEIITHIMNNKTIFLNRFYFWFYSFYPE